MEGILKKICLFLLTFLMSIYFPIQTKAQTAADFLAAGAQNNVISNENFVDINSMDVATIQAFLVANNSYIKDYIDTTETSADAVGENGKSAAQIIYDAAHGLYPAAVGTSHGITIDSGTGTISPKMILVYLQKEQSLISRTTQNDTALARAMGYSCPDASGCNPDYAGFAMQVGWGAWQLRYNYEAAGKGVDWWNSNYGVDNISNCYVGQTKTFSDYTGSYSVTLSNAATASVYRYTPHVFDSAYNAWNLFNYTYFSGSTPPVTPPVTAPRKAGDANGDNAVESTDLSVLADQWGKNVTANTGADFNGDGVVESTDLSVLADAWGK